MKYKLLNFLICPRCKSFPLELVVFKAEYRDRDVNLSPCDTYCGYKKSYIKDMNEMPECKECLKYEIIDGYLRCNKCGEWYPIIDGIVIMLLDDLRPKKVIDDFIKKYKDRLPKDIISSWNKSIKNKRTKS